MPEITMMARLKAKSLMNEVSEEIRMNPSTTPPIDRETESLYVLYTPAPASMTATMAAGKRNTHGNAYDGN